MICRSVTKEDLDTIYKLNEEQDFKLEDISNCVIDKIVEDGREIIAYGIVKRLGEAIVLIDLKAPKISRAKALRELMGYALWGCKKEKIPQLHCFVKNRKVASLLIKQFGFKEVKDIVLVRNI